jgi:hypothetical protein
VQQRLYQSGHCARVAQLAQAGSDWSSDRCLGLVRKDCEKYRDGRYVACEAERACGYRAH